MPKIKVSVLKGKCIGCGTCFATAPEIFSMDVDGKAKVNDEFNGVVIEDPTLIEKARTAASMCPDQAIQIEEVPE